MDRNILIVFIVVISLYLFYRLFFRFFRTTESFTSKSSTVNSLSSANPNKLTISSFNPENLTAKNSIKNPAAALQLSQYCIKGAFNSAFNGSTMDPAMITYVLSRGCRFLDFEVYYSEKGPVVGMSDDPVTPAGDTIPLTEAFDTAMMDAFNSNCPNPDDPLFILIRPKLKDEYKTAMYDSIGSTIQYKLYNLYSGPVTAKTSVTDLMGSVIVVFDKTRDMDYASRSKNLATVVNMETATDNVSISSYTGFKGAAIAKKEGLTDMATLATPEPTPEPTTTEPAKIATSPSVGINEDGYTTNVVNLNIVLPTNYAMVTTTKGIDRAMMANPDFMPIVTKGGQVMLMEFWSNDMYLNSYEAMFNQYGDKSAASSDVGKAVLPLSVAIAFANMNSTYGAVVAYP